MRFLAIVITIVFLFSGAAAQDERPRLDVNAKGVLADGSEEEIVQLEVHEYLRTSFFPLLNYVFFEEDSAELPARYNLFTDAIHRTEFDPQKQFLKEELLNVYLNILNVVALRMRNLPEEKITLIGCNSDEGSEKGNKQLSKARAESVKKYLVDYWKIDPGRIDIAPARNLPDKPSSSKTNPVEAAEENRRVEIVASRNILKPLVVSDTTRVTNPPVIYFRSKAVPEDKIEKSTIFVRQAGKDLRSPIRNEGPPPKNFRWRIKESQIPIAGIPMAYYLTASTSLMGRSKTKSIDVVEYTLATKEKLRMDQSEFERYSLIQFDFGSDELKPEHIEIIESILKTEEIYSDTKFYLSGYTDMIGDEETNLRLSERRAESVKNELLNRGIELDQIKTVAARGESASPYYNSEIAKLVVNSGKYIDPEIESEVNENIRTDYNAYPEGRFLCRTVVIEIENIKKY